MDGHTNSCSSLTVHDRNTILFVLSSVGLVSTIVCFFALFLGVWFRLYKHFVHRLAAYQVLSSLFFDLVCCSQVTFVGYDNNSSTDYVHLCAAVGFFLEYSIWIKLLFMLWLVLHLFCFTVFYKSSEKYEKVCVAGLILFPLLFVWIPFVHDLYGLAGSWCWIQNWKDDCPEEKSELGVIEEYLLLHGPFFVLLSIAMGLIVVMVFVIVKRSTHYLSGSEVEPLISKDRRSQALKELLSLVAYPIFFFLFLIPALSNRIYGAVKDGFNFDSFLVTAITLPAIGFCSGMTLIVHVAILIKYKASRPTTVASCSRGNETIFTPTNVNRVPGCHQNNHSLLI